MILIDANLLVHAHVEDSPDHEAAHRWLDERLNSPEPVGLPWASILTFLRLVTNPRIFPGPLDIEDGWRQVEEWLEAEPTWIPLPTERHRGVLGTLLLGSGARGDLIPDAHLAALAIEHGLILCSTDGDFARFRELRWHNPLTRSA